MSDPLNIAPRRLAPVIGPMAWSPPEPGTAGAMMAGTMLALGAEHAAELAAPAGPAPRLDALADELRPRLSHGRGFALLRGLPDGEASAGLLPALAARLGTPVAPSPGEGRFHAEACDALLLRPTEPVVARLRSAAAIHNALLKQDRAGLAALYEGRGEPALPVFSQEGGAFAGRWDDAALPADRLPADLGAALGEALSLPLRPGDVLVLNPFLVWAERLPAERAAAREEPSRLDAPGFAALR